VKIYKDKDWLYQKYIDEKKSTCEIAKILGCSNVTIFNWLKRYNIKIRTKSKAKIGNKCAFRPLEERFWERVDKNGSNDCWVWMAGCFSNGYGQIESNKKNRRVHVVSFELFYKRKVKDGYILHHICNNKKCCNPAHLQEMTIAEHLSLHHKGKIGSEGEKNGNSKVTEKIVIEIRLKYKTGKYTMKRLAEEYNVTVPLISYIVNRKIWRHV